MIYDPLNSNKLCMVREKHVQLDLATNVNLIPILLSAQLISNFMTNSLEVHFRDKFNGLFKKNFNVRFSLGMKLQIVVSEVVVQLFFLVSFRCLILL